jgi:hypothetical protein
MKITIEVVPPAKSKQANIKDGEKNMKLMTYQLALQCQIEFCSSINTLIHQKSTFFRIQIPVFLDGLAGF